MGDKIKIGRNTPCPCGENRKYKNCCLGKISWETIIGSGNRDEFYRNLSVTGKNATFLSRICEAIQIDQIPQDDFYKFKNAFTPEAVRRVHTSITELWPDMDDLSRIFKVESQHNSGFYFGTYEPETIFRGIIRHSLYDDQILIPDPFVHPLSVREKFNPISNPEEHRINTLRASYVWFLLAPWVYAGIIKFIRLPGDFNPSLNVECMRIEYEKYAHEEELAKIINKSVREKVDKLSPFDRGHGEFWLLSHSNEAIIKILNEYPEKLDEEKMNQFLDHIEQRRKTHPFYIDFMDEKKSHLIFETTGTNYEMAKRTALMTGSHFITDLPSRWKEIELDRQGMNIDPRRWNPFSKAFQNLDFRFLDTVDLQFALQLRKEKRLQNLRSFLKKVWNESSLEDKYDEENAENLAAELLDKMRESEEEWKKIDRDLIKHTGMTALAAVLAIGHIHWLPPVIGIIGEATGLGVSHHRRSTFRDRYPAAMFLDLKSKKR